jgi:hypothetical protein
MFIEADLETRRNMISNYSIRVLPKKNKFDLPHCRQVVNICIKQILKKYQKQIVTTNAIYIERFTRK